MKVLSVLYAAGLTCLLLGATAQAGTFQSITIDGDTSDWAGVPLAHSDPDDNDAGAVDWKDIYIANDDDYLYVRVTLWEAAEATSFESNYYIDGDNNDSTGFNVFASPDFGSSILIQSGQAFQQAGGGFNEGTLANNPATDFSPLFAGPGTEYEFRVDRNITGVAGPFFGQPLITSNTIQLQLQTDTGTLKDVATDAISGIEYTFAVPEPSSCLLGLLGGVMLLVRKQR